MTEAKPQPEQQNPLELSLFEARTVVSPEQIPASLKDYRQWVVWRYEAREGGKPAKAPYQPSKDRARVTDPKTWCSFDQAIECYEQHPKLNGIGFVLTEEAGIVGIDIDDCLNHINEPTLKAKDIMEQLATYTEISPSGEGLRLFATARGVELPSKRKGNLELYTSDRYLTLTGNRVKLAPSTIEDRGDELQDIYGRYLGDVKKEAKPQAPQTQRIFETPRVQDDQVLERLFKGKFGQTYREIYNGDLSRIADQDESRADILLLNGLAFYTFKNSDQMRRLILASPWAAQRIEKWQSMRGKETYLDYRIAEAIRYTK